MEHLHANFNRSLNTFLRLKGDIDNGRVHPVLADAVFHTVENGIGIELTGLIDMLKRRTVHRRRRVFCIGKDTSPC